MTAQPWRRHRGGAIMAAPELRPTGSFEAVPDGAGPADGVDQRAVHVTPEVVRPVVALLVHEPQATADHLKRP